MPIRVEINGRELTPAAGQSLFECADQVEVRVPTSCRKNGKCRECLVEVTAGEELLSPTSPEEAYLRQGFRLSCRACVVGAVGTIRCHTLRRGAMRIEREATGLSDVPGITVHDPAVTRDGDWVLLDGMPLVQAIGPLHGLAVDVGTTTVVMRLVDLESGQVVEAQSFENPQRFAGTDIMARIQFDTEQGGRLLQRTLLAYLGHAIEAFKCDPQTIYEIVVAGNTTMRDIRIWARCLHHRPTAISFDHRARNSCGETGVNNAGRDRQEPSPADFSAGARGWLTIDRRSRRCRCSGMPPRNWHPARGTDGRTDGHWHEHRIGRRESP